MAVGTIDNFVDGMMKGKRVDAVIKESLQEGLPKFLRSLASYGIFEIEITYFSSRGKESCETVDNLEYDLGSGLVHVAHEPIFAGTEPEHKEFACRPNEYVGRLIFPESITFLSIEIFSDRDIGGQATINVETEHKPRKIIELNGGSYVTIADIIPQLRVSYIPYS